MDWYAARMSRGLSTISPPTCSTAEWSKSSEWLYENPAIKEFDEYESAIDPHFRLIVRARWDITLTKKLGGMEQNPANPVIL